LLASVGDKSCIERATSDFEKALELGADSKEVVTKLKLNALSSTTCRMQKHLAALEEGQGLSEWAVGIYITGQKSKVVGDM
jgi:hypothetical protein